MELKGNWVRNPNSSRCCEPLEQTTVRNKRGVELTTGLWAGKGYSLWGESEDLPLQYMFFVEHGSMFSINNSSIVMVVAGRLMANLHNLDVAAKDVFFELIKN